MLPHYVFLSLTLFGMYGECMGLKKQGIATYILWKILNKCPLIYEVGQGYFSTNSKYSLAISHVNGLIPSKSAGFVRIPSALIIPCTFVYSKHLYTSSRHWTFPFANIGTETASLKYKISLIYINIIKPKSLFV